MTLPIIPTPGWVLAQALGKGLGMADDRRRENEQLQRQQDIQNVSLWSQLLPGLASYTPPVQSGPIENAPFGIPYIPPLSTPEQFSVPNAPGPVAQSLQRITGQPNLGLTPGTKQEMRRGALEASTFGDTVKKSKLDVQGAEQNLALGEVRLKDARYDLDSAPARDAAAYAITVAPAYVNAALATGIQPTAANAQRIVDQSYDAFVRSDTSPWRQRISKEMFAKAVKDEIDDAEKLGLAWYNAKTARRQLDDPWKYVQMSADNYDQQLRQLNARWAQIQTAIPTISDMMLMSPEGRKALPPEQQEMLAEADRIQKTRPFLAERQQQLQNMIDKQFAGLKPLDTNAPRPEAVGPAGPVGQSYDSALSYLDSSGNKAIALAWINSREASGEIDKATANQLRGEIRKRPGFWVPGRTK